MPRGRSSAANAIADAALLAKLRAKARQKLIAPGVYRVDRKGAVAAYSPSLPNAVDSRAIIVGAGGSVLFFDEADALFGKRTTVKDSHDRFG